MFQDNHNISGPSTSLVRASATKRALFQSPEKDKFDAKQLLFPSMFLLFQLQYVCLIFDF